MRGEEGRDEKIDVLPRVGILFVGGSAAGKENVSVICDVPPPATGESVRFIRAHRGTGLCSKALTLTRLTAAFPPMEMTHQPGIPIHNVLSGLPGWLRTLYGSGVSYLTARCLRPSTRPAEKVKQRCARLPAFPPPSYREGETERERERRDGKRPRGPRTAPSPRAGREGLLNRPDRPIEPQQPPPGNPRF